MKIRILILLLLLIKTTVTVAQDKLDLSGEWMFELDRSDVGVTEKWFNRNLKQTIMLPGSLQEQGYGDEVSLDTKWSGYTGSEATRKWFFESEELAKYREKGNVKVPFWLNPEKHYVGVAWYQKEFTLSEAWENKRVVLNLERPHWETTLFVNGEVIGADTAMGLPHRYELTTLRKGSNRLTIRVNNSMVVDLGLNAHSISDHTQSNWNGIVGEIYLEKKEEVSIERISIKPNFSERMIYLDYFILNNTNKKQRVSISYFAKAQNHLGANLTGDDKELVLKTGQNRVSTRIKMTEDTKLWDEFTPNLYELNVKIAGKKINTVKKETFGLRKLTREGRRFAINDRPIFLRGTLECAIFPYTGFPAMDDAYWRKIYTAVKAHGLNHIRFHSWCPPRAAFRVADQEGIYLQVEASSWPTMSTSIGDGKPIDTWLYTESKRMIDEYGNHPSFCMLAHGNEPEGKNQVQYLSDLISYWQEYDGQRLYTSSGGWPYVENSDFFNSPTPRIQGWGEGLNSVINSKNPSTNFDYAEIIRKIEMPTVSHEIGQWCVYPNFKEIDKYTGVLKAKNFEIFEQSLNEKGLGHLADQYLMASGKLQALCYKADIEAALRTPEFAGFQLLDLHDFPGQGTALVGVLDPFWDSKGYITAEEYRRFCNKTVPLARIEKLIWQADEIFKAKIELAHFEQSEDTNIKVLWRISNKFEKIITRGEFMVDTPIDNCIEIGDVSLPLEGFAKAEELKLTVSIPAKNAENDWNFWVYPMVNIELDEIYVTDTIDNKAKELLRAGGKVLFAPKKNSVIAEYGGDVMVGFSSIFWNTAWTSNQPPHTLGILCNPEHPALQQFPTDYHSDYQWWESVTRCNAMDIGHLPKGIEPIVRIIDDWVTNDNLAAAFEVKIGRGKLLVTSIDLDDNIEERVSTKQLKYSFVEYMKSEEFDPQVEVEIESITQMFTTNAN